MKYITIKDIKRKSKLERKSYIAKKYNYASGLYLIPNYEIVEKKEPIQYLNELIDEIIRQRELFTLLVKHGSYQEISSYIIDRFLHKNYYTPKHEAYNQSLIWRERAKKMVNGICFLYTHKRDSSNLSLIENYVDLINWKFDGCIEHDIKKYYEELKDNAVFKELIDEIVIGYKMPECLDKSPSLDTLQQWGFLTMQFFDFNYVRDYIEIQGLTSNNRNDIIDFLKKYMLGISIANKYLDPNNKLLDYLKSFVKNLNSLTNEEKDFNNELLESLKTVY